jgi:hypothetical protein
MRCFNSDVDHSHASSLLAWQALREGKKLVRATLPEVWYSVGHSQQQPR